MASDVSAATPAWLARGEHEMPVGDDWLTAAESARAAAMPFMKRRKEYLLRRWVGKCAVATLSGLPLEPRSWSRIEITHRPGGAPDVNLDGAPAAIDVSLSDRAGWAVCVLGVGLGALGCDLELVEPRTPAFVADFLTPGEQGYVASRPAADRDAAATLVWSAKESALKVLRTGLRRDTRSVEVVGLEPVGTTGWAGFEVHTPEGRVLSGWWVRAGSFLVTVASESSLGRPTALPGCADLAMAEPMHRWADNPLSG